MRTRYGGTDDCDDQATDNDEVWIFDGKARHQEPASVIAGLVVYLFWLHFFSRPEFTSIPDDNLVFLRQAGENLDPVISFLSQLDLPLVYPACRDPPSARWLRSAVTLDRLYGHGEGAILLIQSEVSFRVHAVDQRSVAILDVDFGLHRPGLLIERVGKTRDFALKGPVQSAHLHL